MSDGSNVPFDPSSPEQQGLFRKAAAGLLKTFILARGKAEPGFATPRLRKMWWGAPKDFFPDISRRSALALLREAGEMLRRFQDKYSGYRDSIPASQSDTDKLIDDLRECVLSFVDLDKVRAALKLSGPKQIDWKSLANWPSLDQLRTMLNELPAPTTESEKPQEDDGPIKPNKFRYQGNTHAGCPPKAWGLIDAVYKAPGQCVTFNELARQVWPESRVEDVPALLDGAVRSAVYKANQFFRTKSIPFALRVGFEHLKNKKIKHVVLDKKNGEKETSEPKDNASTST